MRKIPLIQSESRRFIIKNYLILSLLTIILIFLPKWLVCSNSWKIIGIYFQIIGVILVSLWAVSGGLWGTQSLAKYFKGHWQKLPIYLAILGLPFILAGLILQL